MQGIFSTSEVAWLPFSLILVFSITTWAQNTGRMHGTVKDPTGASIPAAQIAVTNPATGLVRHASTDSAGAFVVPSLPIGTYNVEVKAQGFTPTNVKDLVLHIGEGLLVDVTMRVGQVQEQVSVAAEAPLTDTLSPEVGNVIQEQRVQNLPLNGRNVLQLALLAPGAAEPDPGNGIEKGSFTSGGFTVSINGGRLDENEYLLDGVWDGIVYFNQQNILPTVDAVSEFRVIGTNADASRGFGHGGVIIYSTVSGGNNIHGKVWEFLRNDVLDARNFFDRTRPPYRQNQFGAIVTGPVLLPGYNGKDRTHFMFGYEGLRIHKGLTALTTIPTSAEIGGDFSADAPIYDPLTTRPDPSNPGKFLRDPFPGNKIPSNRIASQSAFLASFFPLISQGGVGNFVNNPTLINNRDQYNARIDHSFSTHDQVFGRVTVANFDGRDPLASGVVFAAAPPFNPPSLPTTEGAFSRNVALGWTHVFSSSVVNQFLFGFNRSRMPRDQRGPDFFGKFGIQGANRNPADFGLPSISFTGLSPFGGTDVLTPFDLTETDFQYTDNVSLVRGRHSLDFGGTFLRTRLAHRFDFFSKTSLSYSGGFTANPENAASTGNSFADFLLGYPASVLAGVGDTGSHSFQYRIEGYITDTLKLTRKLTAELGLRYEVLRPPLFEEPVSALDLKTGDMVINVPGNGPLPPQVYKFIPLGIKFVTARSAGFPETLVDTNKKNFGPRVGFAYDVQGDGKTVVRAGYGLFYAQRQQVNSTAQMLTDIPFYNISLALNGGVGGPLPTPSSLTPTISWNNLLTNAAAPPGGTTIPRYFPLGQVHQWSLSVQRQVLSDTALELDYVGSSGHKLIGGTTVNQIDIIGEVYPKGTRPFSQYGNFTSWRGSGNSSYNALIINANKRLRSGLTFQAGYTYSHSIDTASLENFTGGSSNFTQDTYAPESAEKGNSEFDTRHRFIISYFYELPIGPGKRFLSLNGVAGKLVGGWRVSGITTRAGGVPITPGFAVEPTGTGSFGVRPNGIGDPNQNAPHTPQEWFNTKAFGIQTTPTFGNARRNTITGPWINNWDISFSKDTPLTERYHLACRADMFNTFNHPQFLQPVRLIDSPEFGKVFQARDPRQIQFSLGLSF